MGTGTQACQLHGPQTGLRSLCACFCVHPARLEACPPLSCVLWLAGSLSWIGGGQDGVSPSPPPIGLPAENWLAGLCIW